MQVVPVYLDIPLIGAFLGWVQDSALLWMVAQICSVKVTYKRLLLGGAVGGCFQFLLLMNQASEGLLDSWILSPLLTIVVAPLVMISATYCPAHFKKIILVAGYFYLLAFLLSGINWGFDSLNTRFFHLHLNLFWRFWSHLMCLFLLGELGWGIVHRKLWERVCFYPIQIDWDGRQLKLNALLDTGNRLHDPFTKVPVIIIELKEIKDLLPKEVIQLTESFNSGEIALNKELPDYWNERVRLLPFNSLGYEHGILFGFRPDQIRVWYKQAETISKNVVVALYNRPLSREGAYQALIPPAVLSN